MARGAGVGSFQQQLMLQQAWMQQQMMVQQVAQQSMYQSPQMMQPMRMPSQMSAWVMYYNQHGQPYYYNGQTGEHAWPYC